MTKILRVVLAAILLALQVSAGAAPLRVALTDNYPPYVYRAPNGELQGYAVDTWRLWEKKTGIPVELQGTTWAQAQQLVLSGQSDVIDMIFATPGREQLYDFSAPYAQIRTAIYADASISGLHDLADLKGLLVGVEEGDACAEHLRRAGVSTLRTFPDYASLANAVSSQDVKVFCLDEYPANYYLYRLGMQKRFVKEFDLYRDKFRRAVRKGDTQTLATVNRGMALITPQEDARLRDKWMGQAVVFPEYAARLGQAVLALALLTLVLLAWLYSVRKAVRRRTVELEEEKARLRTLVENSPDVIWLKDTAGHYLSCNRQGALLLCKPESEIVGRTDSDLFPAPDAERYRADDVQALRTRTPITTEDLVLSAGSGEVHYMETIRTAVVRPDGEVLGILGVARDVTVRRLQEQTIHEQEALLSEMSELAQIGGWEFDMVTGHVVWTEELARIHETPLAGARSIPNCLSYYHGESRTRVEEALRQAVTAGATCDVELEMVTERGNHKWVRAISRPVIENGKVVKVRGTLQDITERRRLEESMRMANLIYQTSYEAIAVTDAANKVVDANPAYLRLTGCNAAQVIGAVPVIFHPDMHDAAFYERMWQELALHDQWQGEIRGRARDGSQTARLVSIRVVRNPDGKVYRHVIQFFDITEQKKKDELIWRQTNFDPLTGLPNRRLFVDRLEQEIRKTLGSGAALGLMFIDLDRFKQVNDTFGRPAGDRVLLEATRRLQSRVPGTATLARLGGDSFALIMSPMEKRLHMDMTAAALVDALSAPIPVEDGELAYVTASVGIAVCPDDGTQAEELLMHAEQAMQMAKQDGRGRFSYLARSAQREAQAKLLLTNDLRRALARGELHLFYQPIVEAASGRIRKAEALLRWSHPLQGMVSPARFIPLAEESGLIVEIGEWVFQEAIASIERWQRKFGKVIELSVNNSPVQFQRSGACQWIDHLARSGLPPASLTVEITEGVLLRDAEHVMHCLKRLHETGTKISIDDFGTGFSSLSYLKRLDVDYLKIDKSFVANLVNDDDDQALTGAIVDMAHKLGIQTIAEGVETVEQRDLLNVFGCDFIQGNLYSRPVPRDIFEVLLEPQEAH
jgi:diguanylate cyclase (GGDEF)-like protein/PAS domain S-box-containing protein